MRNGRKYVYIFVLCFEKTIFFRYIYFFIFLKCSDMYFTLSLIKIGDKKFHQKIVQKCLLIFLNTPCRAGLKPQAPDTLGLNLKPTGSRLLLVIVSESG